MTPEQISLAAAKVYRAEASGKQCGLLSVSYPEMNLVDAYRIQASFVKLKQAAGARKIGWKIGLTSRTMRRKHGMKAPNYGVLLDGLVMQSGDFVPADRLIDPRVEAEIGFRMKADVEGSTTTRSDVLAAIDYLTPAIEIRDSRIRIVEPDTGVRRLATDSVSDNASVAGVVIGNERHLVGSFDLRWVGAILKRNGYVEETGLAAGVLDDPVESIVWLARRLAAQGEKIRTGDLVLSGSFLRSIGAPKGSKFEIDYGRFGQININFA